MNHPAEARTPEADKLQKGQLLAYEKLQEDFLETAVLPRFYAHKPNDLCLWHWYQGQELIQTLS